MACAQGEVDALRWKITAGLCQLWVENVHAAEEKPVK